MWAYAVKALSPIAVLTKDLESSRISVCLQPSVHHSAAPNTASVCSSVVVYMVNCQELWLCFSAASTFIAISLKNIFPESHSLMFILLYMFVVIILDVFSLVAFTVITFASRFS